MEHISCAKDRFIKIYIIFFCLVRLYKMSKMQVVKVKLSPGQKQKIASAMRGSGNVTVRLNKNAMTGPDSIMMTKTQMNKRSRSMSKGTGMQMTMSRAQLNAMQKNGGILGSLLKNLVKGVTGKGEQSKSGGRRPAPRSKPAPRRNIEGNAPRLNFAQMSQASKQTGIPVATLKKAQGAGILKDVLKPFKSLLGGGINTMDGVQDTSVVAVRGNIPNPGVLPPAKGFGNRTGVSTRRSKGVQVGRGQMDKRQGFGSKKNAGGLFPLGGRGRLTRQQRELEEPL